MKKVLMAVWAYCGYVFVAQWGRSKSETTDGWN